MYVGLDLSLTGTGVVFINDDYSIAYSEEFSLLSKGVDRLLFLENKLLNCLDGKEINLACIEGPAYHDTGRIFEIGEWNGIVKLHLFKLGIQYIIATPLQLKKYASGYGGKGVTKDLIMLDVFKNFGVEIRNNNVADAYVLARIAHDYYYRYTTCSNIELKKYQDEVLEKIYKGNGALYDKKII